MSKITTSPEAAYLTSPNIVHPASLRGSAGDPVVAAAEVAARADITNRFGVTAAAGSIRKGR